MFRVDLIRRLTCPHRCPKSLRPITAHPTGCATGKPHSQVLDSDLIHRYEVAATSNRNLVCLDPHSYAHPDFDLPGITQ